MNRSPMKIIELCVYLLIIIGAIVYIALSNNKPNPFAATQIETVTELPPVYNVTQGFIE